MTSPEVKNTQAQHDGSEAKQQRHSREGLVGGLVLITLGLLFLGDHLIPDFHFRDYWPVILIAIGIGVLWKGFRQQ